MSVNQIRKRAEWTVSVVTDTRSVLSRTSQSLRELDRPTTAHDVDELNKRLTSGARATVVVVGEFKCGKSSLINAIVGAPIVPAHPTDPTLRPVIVRYGETLSFLGLDDDDNESPLTRSEFERRATTPPGSDGTPQLVANVPSETLAAGIELVDTPPLSDGPASTVGATVLGLVHHSTGLLVVADASQKLTAPELEFLGLARRLSSPTVIGVTTKIDLYPDWRQIRDDNRDLLAGDELGVCLATSAALLAESQLFGDQKALDESGISVLRWHLVATLATDALHRQTAQSLVATRQILSEVIASLDQERAAASDPELAGEIEAAILQRQAMADQLSNRIQDDVRAAVRRFRDESSNQLELDLTQRLRPFIQDTINQEDPGHGWAGIRSRILAEGDRVATQHFKRLSDGLGEAVADAMSPHGFRPADMGLGYAPNVDEHLQGVAIADPQSADGYRISNVEVARNAIGGVTAGAAPVSVLGAALLGGTGLILPLSLLAGAAGMGVALKSAVDRRSAADLQTNRKDALLQADRYHQALANNLRQHARSYFRDVELWVNKALKNERTVLIERIKADIARLAEIRELNETDRAEAANRSSAAIKQLRQDQDLVEKMLFTMARPELKAARR